MRVGVNVRLLQPNKLEGIGRFTLETLRELMHLHPDWTFYFFFDRAFDERFILGPNVVPVVVHPPARHPALFILWFELAIPFQLRKHQIDVFLSPDGYLSLSASIPQVLVSHDLAYLHFSNLTSKLVEYYLKYFVPRFHQRADHIVAVSDFTRQDIHKQYGIPLEKISVGHNALSSEFVKLQDRPLIGELSSFGIQEGDRYFLFVGALHPRKNIVNLIQAFEIVKQSVHDPHLKLVLVGRLAWESDEIKAKLENSRYAKDIIHIPHASDEELWKFYMGAVSLVYVSLFEGFGIPILEAFAAGSPVICSNVSSMPEVGGNAAIYVNPYDLSEIAAAMISTLGASDAKNHRISLGYERLRQYSWSQTAQVLAKAISMVSSASKRLD